MFVEKGNNQNYYTPPYIPPFLCQLLTFFAKLLLYFNFCYEYKQRFNNYQLTLFPQTTKVTWGEMFKVEGWHQRFIVNQVVVLRATWALDLWVLLSLNRKVGRPLRNPRRSWKNPIRPTNSDAIHKRVFTRVRSKSSDPESPCQACADVQSSHQSACWAA